MFPPGRDIEGKRISRSVLWLNLSTSVSTQAKNPEACYLFLQWAGSSRIDAWMTANPGGYFDPFRLSDFSDPLVRQTYHAYHMDIVRETVPRTVPSINYPGATAFHNALDENLVAACTKTKTPEAAMADTVGQAALSDAFPLAFGLAAFSRRNFAEFLMQRSLPFETFRIGARTIVHLGEGASEVKTVFDNDVGLSIGESAIIVPDAEAVCAFDAASGRAIGAM
jgi:hypothetical protein